MVAAVFVMFMFTIGTVINTFSIFGPAIMEEMGLTATETQMMNLFTVAANMTGSVLLGNILKKTGVRRALPVYILIMTAGLVFRGISPGYLALCLSSFVIGAGFSGCSNVVGSVLLNNWFSEKKGLAMGIAFTGSVVGGLVLVQLGKILIASFGWRFANLFLAGLAFVLLMPIALFVVRDRPSDIGLLPYGESITERAGQKNLTGISRGRYIKTLSFALMGLALFLTGFTDMGVQNNVTICLVSEHGHSQETAANVFSVIMFSQIFGKIILGWIYDKRGIFFGTVYNLVLFIGSMIMAFFAGGVWQAVLFGVLFGVFGSVVTVAPPILISKAAGQKDYAAIYGTLNPFIGIGVALGPISAAFVYDRFGSYDPAWWILMGLAVIMSLVTILAVTKAKGYAGMEQNPE